MKRANRAGRSACLAAFFLVALAPLAPAETVAEGRPAQAQAQAAGSTEGQSLAQAHPWLRAVVPDSLRRPGPGGLSLWQWLAIPSLALLALGLGRVLGAGSRTILSRIAQRSAVRWGDQLLPVVSPTLTLLWATALAALMLTWLALPPGPLGVARAGLAALATLACFWALWRSVDVGVQAVSELPSIRDDPSTRSLLSVAQNLLKAFLFVGGVASLLAGFGYPVATVLAGLGIGGIALAFGAQKTIENLFGSVALAVDQPFRVGDFVRIEGFIGNVERIGMRSSQVRTLDRTLISVPNGKLADMQIEDFASRDRIRLHATIGVVYGTTEAQMRKILGDIEAFLRQHPQVWQDTIVVRFGSFGDSSLNIEVMCWFETTIFDEFRDYRQEVLLAIMRIVEAAGSSFAFPTRTLHVVAEPGS